MSSEYRETYYSIQDAQSIIWRANNSACSVPIYFQHIESITNNQTGEYFARLVLKKVVKRLQGYK